jgi:GxxExxY protein
MKQQITDINQLTGAIIGAAIEVHKILGPGLLESIYEECVCFELNQKGILFERQKEIDTKYKGLKLENKYRVDILVDNLVIVELKACEELLPIHEAQLLTYLKLTGLAVGLLINFNVAVLKEGIKRMRL